MLGLSALFLLALHAGAGMLVGMTLVPVKDAGRPFFVVSGAIVLCLLGAALGLALAGVAPGAVAPSIAGAATLLLVAQMVLLRAGRWAAATVAVRVAAAVAFAATIAGGIETARHFSAGGAGAALAATAAAGQALFVGSTALSMILGHFYLVLPRLSIQPLRRLTALFVGSLGLRVVTCVVGLAVAARAAEGGLRALVFAEGVAVLPRVLFGLVGPLIVAYMIWETVRIRSTQSATGILYAATAMVLLGEGSAAWLIATRGIWS